MKTFIEPVPVFPSSANVLEIRPVSFGADGPSYFYALCRVTETAPAVPAIPATDSSPEVPASPEITERVELLSGNVSMTKEQWNSWAEDADDEQYQLDCAAANLNLTRVV
jgi:hypothetical protein